MTAQSYSQGINQKKCVGLFRYSDWCLDIRLKVGVFLQKSYAGFFGSIKVSRQLAPRLEIITPDKIKSKVYPLALTKAASDSISKLSFELISIYYAPGPLVSHFPFSLSLPPDSNEES